MSYSVKRSGGHVTWNAPEQGDKYPIKVFDIDLTQEASRTLADGSATIGGLTWDVVGNVNANTIAFDGTGLRIVHNLNQSAVGSPPAPIAPNAPRIFLPRANMPSNFDPDRQIEISAIYETNFATFPFQTTTPLGIAVVLGYNDPTHTSVWIAGHELAGVSPNATITFAYGGGHQTDQWEAIQRPTTVNALRYRIESPAFHRLSHAVVSGTEWPSDRDWVTSIRNDAAIGYDQQEPPLSDHGVSFRFQSSNQLEADQAYCIFKRIRLRLF